MIWSSNVEQNQYFVVQIIGQLQYLGKKAIGRGQPQCDITKAGIVPCNILYFPHLEHRCQAVKRLAKIFGDVAQHCNSSWKKLYGDMMNALLQNNTHGKHGASCPAVEWLPAYWFIKHLTIWYKLYQIPTLVNFLLTKRHLEICCLNTH